MNKSAINRTNNKRTWLANFGGTMNCGTFVRKEIPGMR